MTDGLTAAPTMADLLLREKVVARVVREGVDVVCAVTYGGGAIRVNVLRSVADGIGTITLNRPDRMNAITTGLSADLAEAIADLGADPEVRVILIVGAGGNFCAGGDFDEVNRLRDEGAEALARLFTAFRAACDAIASVAVPVVCAVRGVAAAGGFELIQAADIVLVSDDARIADSHIKFGMIPGGGSTARLPRIVGVQQALGLLLSGDQLSGPQAVALGLAYRSYPADEFDEAAAEFVTKLAGRRRESVATIKRLVRDGRGRSLPEALDSELDAAVQHIIETGSGAEQFAGRQSREVRA